MGHLLAGKTGQHKDSTGLTTQNTSNTRSNGSNLIAESSVAIIDINRHKDLHKVSIAILHVEAERVVE